jgi:hypothetical protein
MKINKEFINNVFIAILVLIIFSFVSVTSFYLFKKIFIDSSVEDIYDGMSAFMGAFFAFLFVRLGIILDKIREREKEVFNEYVFLGRYLNGALITLNDNISLMNALFKSLKSGEIFVSRLKVLPLRDEALMKLTDLNYINKLFSLTADFKRLNDDIETVNNWNNELKTALIQNHINFEKYKSEAARFAQEIEVIKKYSEDLLNNRIPEVLAEDRIYLSKNKTILGKINDIIYKRREIKKEEIKSEKKRLLKEIEETKNKNKEELEKAGIKQYVE